MGVTDRQKTQRQKTQAREGDNSPLASPEEKSHTGGKQQTYKKRGRETDHCVMWDH